LNTHTANKRASREDQPSHALAEDDTKTYAVECVRRLRIKVPTPTMPGRTEPIRRRVEGSGTTEELVSP
jgi:hypothetical protein